VTAPAVNFERLRTLFDAGLVGGLGTESQTCIEGAIALACGEGLTDMPSCVAEPDRRWAIRINDAKWSSEAVRADALWPVALAQIGTAGADRLPWARAIALGTVRRVLPLLLDERGLTKEAAACRAAEDLEAARLAAQQAGRALYSAAAYADGGGGGGAFADAYAAAAASFAAFAAAAYAAAFAAAADAAAADAYAADAAAAYAAFDAYAFDAYAADAYAADAAAKRDQILREAVAVALDAYAAEGRHTPEAQPEGV